MELGELSIISRQGVELKAHVVDLSTIEQDHHALEQERYLSGYDMNCNNSEVELNAPVGSIPIHPLDIHMEGDYISGAFKDNQRASGPYKVKIWLMLEESAKAIGS
ncbi:hypothetical protein C9994_00155 [Marivirga lumbricoides]|uniref:Uncharacterized protein n=1 Tax=Marivirga lumbricoides TaxID=1046115 RepID=A0A2T4DW17_9BACT|nr:hypothetical protein C9994_00155 [Marivirga lumbricoides]